MASLTTLFTPPPDCQDAIIAAVDRAQRTIRVWIYTFSNPAIANAFIAAEHRGVDIQVVVDQSLQKYKNGLANLLAKSGIPVFVDCSVRIQHMKSVVIDDQVVITGSYNFSLAAEHDNAEDLMIIDDQPTASQYLANWLARTKQASPWQTF